jgi:hypothetical protein
LTFQVAIRIGLTVPVPAAATWAYSLTMAAATRAQARQAILDLLDQRDSGKTICPSDAARALGGDDGFRPLMDLVREAAGELVASGRVEVTQGGEPVDLDRARGPIRLRSVRDPRNGQSPEAR